MPGIPDTVGMTGPVAPKYDTDTYASHIDKYGKGGFAIMDSEADMLAIPRLRRTIGMWRRFNDNGTWKIYELINNPSGDTTQLSDWQEVSFEGSGTTQYIGSFTPILGDEYPDTTDLDSGVWGVEGVDISAGYTFTTGDLAGKTVYNENGIIFNSVTGWSLVADYREPDMWKYYYVPKTVYISKQGDDSTGKIENSKYHFATFMGAYNAIPDNAGNNWEIEYIKTSQFDEVFVENNIYTDNNSGIRYLTVIVPKGITLTCNTANDKSLFERGTGFANNLAKFSIKGLGKFTRSGNPTNPTNCHVFAGLYYYIESAEEIINYTGGNCSNSEYSTFKNIDKIESTVGSISSCNSPVTFEKVTEIVSENWNFYYGNNVTTLKDCRSIRSTTKYNAWGYGGTIEAEDCVFEVDNYYANFVSYWQTGKLKNCKFINNQDVDSNDCNLYLNYGFREKVLKLDNCEFVVKNPIVKNNIRFFTTGVLYDAYIYKSRFNAGIQDLKNSTSDARIVRRKFDDGNYTVPTVGQDYDLYITPYNNDLWTNSKTVKLTVTAQTTSEEDLIDLFVTAFDDYKMNNPESVLEGLTIVKGFDTGKVYFDIVGDNITYRENTFYSSINGVNSPQEFTQELVQGTYAGVLNVIDIDNINKEILINNNVGKGNTELIHI